MSDGIVYVTDETFDTDVLQSERPVLVDCWADWCKPCHEIAPILDEVSGEYHDKITIAKLDVEENQTTPSKFGIRGVPTLVLFKDGIEVARFMGTMSKSQLTAFIDSNI